jgi:hypothetical protein
LVEQQTPFGLQVSNILIGCRFLHCGVTHQRRACDIANGQVRSTSVAGPKEQ